MPKWMIPGGNKAAAKTFAPIVCWPHFAVVGHSSLSEKRARKWKEPTGTDPEARHGFACYSTFDLFLFTQCFSQLFPTHGRVPHGIVRKQLLRR